MSKDLVSIKLFIFKQRTQSTIRSKFVNEQKICESAAVTGLVTLSCICDENYITSLDFFLLEKIQNDAQHQGRVGQQSLQ